MRLLLIDLWRRPSEIALDEVVQVEPKGRAVWLFSGSSEQHVGIRLSSGEEVSIEVWDKQWPEIVKAITDSAALSMLRYR